MTLGSSAAESNKGAPALLASPALVGHANSKQFASDIAVYRPSTGQWFVQGGATVAWGGDGDVPQPGDYDGDGRSDHAVYRPSTGQWFVLGGEVVPYGASGDVALPLPPAIRTVYFPGT